VGVGCTSVNLNAPLARPGGRWGPPGDLLAEARPPHSAPAVASGPLAYSVLLSWSWLPPGSPSGVGKVAKSRPGLRPGYVGLALPGLLATGR
jgi:hypothetical protein